MLGMVRYIPSRSSLDAWLQARLGGLQALVDASVRRLGVPERSVCRSARCAGGLPPRCAARGGRRRGRRATPDRLFDAFAQALGDACRLGLSRQNSWNPLVRLPLSGQPGSSTPAGFARMEPALCRIPLPYPSPWRPRKSHDRARPGWEVVAPRVTAPSPCRTFRLFSIVLGTEKSYNLKGPFGRN